MIALPKVENKKDRLEFIKSEIHGHFLAVGRYLFEVKQDELFLLDNVSSFRLWIVEVLGYTPSWAYQHIKAYEANQTLLNEGSLPLANISASRELNHITRDVENIDHIAIALLATELAIEDGLEALTVEHLNRAYQMAISRYPQPVIDFCQRFNISNPEKTKIISEWFFKGAGRDDSKWSFMENSGKLILFSDDNDSNDDVILDLATCSAADMSEFALMWQNHKKQIADDANPNKQKYSGMMSDIIKKLFEYRHKKARVVVYLDD